MFLMYTRKRLPNFRKYISGVKLPIVQQLSMTAYPPQPAGRILFMYFYYDFYELNKNVSL